MQALLRNGGARALANAGRGAFAPAGTSASSLIAPTAGTLGSPRWIGDTGVPENYGQWKDGGPGTGFLGTPKNHRELLEKRPMSPDVLDIDGERVHYKFPAVALSSITNRVTGCVLSGGVAFGGVLSFVGGPETLPAFVEGFKSWLPFMVYPTKLAFGFPFVYHTLGGFRHLYWDKTTEGIDNQSAKASSIALFAASGGISAMIAGWTF